MAVAHLRIPEGVPFVPGLSDPGTMVSELILERFREIELLSWGEHVVTPETWAHNTHDHRVTVFDDGTGLYRALSRHAEADYLKVSDEGSQVRAAGGHQALINAKQPVQVISQETQDPGGEIRIFALLTHIAALE